jgi:hypothetical protein
MNKYDIVNSRNQRCGDCIDFDGSGKFGNCQQFPDWQKTKHPCVICKGEICENYRKG